MHLFQLPPEIIHAILSHLSPSDLLSCQLTSKYLNNAILNSVGILYNRALTLASATDSPFSTRPTAERLRSLNAIENAWAKMRTDFVQRSEVPLRESGVYDLTGGVYLLSTADRTGLGYMRLPSKEGEKGAWEMVQVGKLIVDVGLCVYEHDLMAVITSALRSTPAGEPNTYDIAIDLIELSTKKPHPLAQTSSIHVMNSLWERPSVGIEIVGKHLVLVLSFSAREHPEDRIFIYEWQTGVLIASFEARCHTYGSILFLDEDHFLLPNTRTNALDIYRIPPAPTLARLEPILQLELPPLVEGRILGFLCCRAEPNPIGKDSYPNMRARRRRPATASPGAHATPERAEGGEERLDLLPERDFLLEASSALCMFELRIHLMMFHLVPGGGLQMGFPFRYSFTFVAHRAAFLELIARHAVPSDATTTTLGPPSPSHPKASHGKDPASKDPASTPTTPPAGPPKLAYDAWGPPVTRWFGSNEYDVSVRWITTSAGGRCVRMPAPRGLAEQAMVGAGTEGEGERFYVYDFNQRSVEAARRRRDREKEKEMETAGLGAEEGGKEKERKEGVDKKGPKAGGGGKSDGDESDGGDDGAPRRDKGKGKMRAEEAPPASEDEGAGTLPRGRSPKRRLARRACPSRGGRLLFAHEGPSEAPDAEVEARRRRLERERDWILSLADEEEEEEEEEARDRGEDREQYPMDDEVQGLLSASDHAMDMFDEGSLPDDQQFHDDHDSEDEEHDQDMHATLFGYDHAEDNDDDDEEEQEDDAEAPNARDHAMLVADGDFDGDELVLPDFDIHDADAALASYADREDWTFDFLPTSGTAVLDEASVLDCPEVFQRPIRHSLPCIIRGSEAAHRWNGVLLDEERVIGIMADPMTGHVEEIEIHHFG